TFRLPETAGFAADYRHTNTANARERELVGLRRGRAGPCRTSEAVAERRGRSCSAGGVLESYSELCDPDLVSSAQRPRRLELFAVHMRSIPTSEIVKNRVVAGDRDRRVTSRHRR